MISTTSRPGLAASRSISSGLRTVRWDVFSDRYTVGGSLGNSAIARSIVASSSCVPSSSAAASANHSFGGRGGSERNRASASYPTGWRVVRSTIGWTWIARPSPATNRWISAARARIRWSSISSRRSCDDSSSTIPSTTSADTLARPLATRWIESTISSPRGALDEVADRAGAEHLQDRRAVLERRQRDHPGARRGADDLAGRPGPAAGRHAHVDERHVGLLALGERDGLVRVGGGADERERGLLRQERGQGVAERGLVVGQQDAHMRVAAQGKGGAHGG